MAGRWAGGRNNRVNTFVSPISGSIAAQSERSHGQNLDCFFNENELSNIYSDRGSVAVTAVL